MWMPFPIYKVCISQKALLTNIHQQYLLDIHVWCKFIKLKLASTLSEGSVKFTKKSEWTIYTYTRPSGISLYRNFRCIFFNDFNWKYVLKKLYIASPLPLHISHSKYSTNLTAFSRIGTGRSSLALYVCVLQLSVVCTETFVAFFSMTTDGILKFGLQLYYDEL
jgi:hypothetical protein